MPNEFQSTSSGTGLLKTNYDENESDVSKALKQRVKKMAAKVKIQSVLNDEDSIATR